MFSNYHSAFTRSESFCAYIAQYWANSSAMLPHFRNEHENEQEFDKAFIILYLLILCETLCSKRDNRQNINECTRTHSIQAHSKVHTRQSCATMPKL